LSTGGRPFYRALQHINVAVRVLSDELSQNGASAQLRFALRDIIKIYLIGIFEFNRGSSEPIMTGSMACVRVYSNFEDGTLSCYHDAYSMCTMGRMGRPTDNPFLLTGPLLRQGLRRINARTVKSEIQ
jgi:hypothetical protein